MQSKVKDAIQILKTNGWTQAEIGFLCGVDRGSIFRWEKGLPTKTDRNTFPLVLVLERKDDAEFLSMLSYIKRRGYYSALFDLAFEGYKKGNGKCFRCEEGFECGKCGLLVVKGIAKGVH